MIITAQRAKALQYYSLSIFHIRNNKLTLAERLVIEDVMAQYWQYLTNVERISLLFMMDSQSLLN